MPTDLREQLGAEAARIDVGPVDAALPYVLRVSRRRIVRRRALTLGSLVIVVVLATATVIAANAGGKPSTVRIEQQAPTAVLYVEPVPVPNGMTLRYAQGGDDPRTQPRMPRGVEGLQRWVRFDATRSRPLDILEFHWFAREASGDPLAGSRGTPVEVRGRRGVYEPGQHWLTWLEAPDRRVFIGADLELAQLQDIAATVRQEADGGYDLDAPPEYEFVGESGGQASFGDNIRQMTYGDQSGRLLRVSIGTGGDTPLMNLSQPNAEAVEVRGHRAAVSTRVWAGPGSRGGPPWAPGDPFIAHNPELFVGWRETPDVVVLVDGYRVDRATLLAFARSLRPVDEQRWSALVTSTGQTFTPGATLPSSQTTVDTGDWQVVDDHEFRVKIPPDWRVQRGGCLGVNNTLALVAQGEQDECDAPSDGDWIALEVMDPQSKGPAPPCEKVRFKPIVGGCRVVGGRTETWYVDGLDIIVKAHSAATGSRMPSIAKFWGYTDPTRPEANSSVQMTDDAAPVWAFANALLACSQPELQRHAPGVRVDCTKPGPGTRLESITATGMSSIKGTKVRMKADASVNGKRRVVMQVEYRWFPADRRSRLVIVSFDKV